VVKQSNAAVAVKTRKLVMKAAPAEVVAMLASVAQRVTQRPRRDVATEPI
jgi:hypothetical protein